jgi:hypothetical protein
VAIKKDTNGNKMRSTREAIRGESTGGRGLHDDQLAKSGTVFTDAPATTVAQLITSGLITHVDAHFASIWQTVGNDAAPKRSQMLDGPFVAF